MKRDEAGQTGIRWLAALPQFRELRGGELRWIVSQETTLNEATGERHTRAVIRHPGVTVIVPVLDDGRLLLMRQYRYSLNGDLWEFPAGTLHGREAGRFVESDETPEECAARELEEETGWRAARLECLGDAYAMPGMSDERIWAFAARGLTKTKHKLDEGELIREVRDVSPAEFGEMLARGDIRDAKTIVAWVLFGRAGGSSP